ncbi:hypothetical protein Hypma_000102 [Hypsizygus marmoreus]|uniref:2OGFeDO JBP1/TET oxygenase domain-containing protein n=1 Tax=Hypsizygus marmoreus TaxID=39966 RepID=A0A369KBP4_HYPMA|nr:hypothetical protein Hypma_000102 [Hypsizygus marmoreus]
MSDPSSSDSDILSTVSRLRAALTRRLEFVSQKPETRLPSVTPSTGTRKKRPRPRPRPRPRSDKKYDEHRLLQAVSAALLNCVYLEWDLETYASTPPHRRAQKFPNPQLGHFSKPTTFADKNGVIVLWYLPNVLPHQLQNDLLRSTHVLNSLLSESVQPNSSFVKKTGTLKTTSWRFSNRYCVPPSSSRSVASGSVNFSAGWFAQGHSSKPYPLRPSRNLRTSLPARVWLSQLCTPEYFVNLILALTHPKLFDAAWEVLMLLRRHPDTQHIATMWHSVFTGIAVIANRVTPAHVDRSGRPDWYDLLLSIGTFSHATLNLPDLGASFSYAPGTVVNLCGNVLTHEVMTWGKGDRICYAHFFRKAVFARLGMEWIGGVNRSDFAGL